MSRWRTRFATPASVLLGVGMLGTACRTLKDGPAEAGAASTPSSAASLTTDGGTDASLEGSALVATFGDGARIRASCDAFAAAYCQRARTCAKLTFLLDHADDASCVLERAAACRREMRAAGTGWSPAAMDACTEAVTKRACGLWNDLDAMDIAACHPRGTLEVGAAAEWDSQCKSGVGRPDRSNVRRCAHDASTAPESIVIHAFNEGHPTIACPHGMILARTVCLRIAYPGQACQVSAAPYDPCLLSFCANVDNLGRGRCERGRGCGTELDVPKCGRWQTCNTGTGACDDVKLAADGAACDDERIRCHGGSRCVRGRCARLGRSGDACGLERTSSGCAAPATCDGGRCVAADD